MSSYGLHLANLAEARGLDLAARSVETLLCSAEPLSDAKREKLARQWGAQVRDTFGMTEAGMMGAEDAAGRGFRIWTDMFLIEVLDPDSQEPVNEGAVGALVVTPLWTNTITPFLRWSSGDLVTWQEAGEGDGPFSVFPLVRHAHRTTGFFKVRGINLNHAELEDFMFRNVGIADFKAEWSRARSRRAAAVVGAAARRPADRGGPNRGARSGLTPGWRCSKRHAGARVRGERPPRFVDRQ
jgi:phenylacetate-CoA ligase